MKRFFLTLLLFATFLSTITAQYFPIDTARLNSAYRAIISGERNIKTEMEFLETYPTTWLEFYMTYNYVDDKEYDIEMSQLCTEHISTLFAPKPTLQSDTPTRHHRHAASPRCLQRQSHS